MRTPADKAPSRQAVEAGYERADPPIGPILYFLLALALLSLLILAATGWLFHWMERRESLKEPPRHALAGERVLPAGPRLEVDPSRELERTRREEERLLEGYGWVDRSRGIVRIPIERAMELVLKQGLPVEPAASGKKGERP